MTRQEIIIRHNSKDKDILNSVISKGTSPARTIRRAHILLNCNAEGDKQYTIDELTDLLNTSKQTVCRVLKDYKVIGIECIYRKKRKTPPVECQLYNSVNWCNLLMV